jgi:hypothetical protein
VEKHIKPHSENVDSSIIELHQNYVMSLICQCEIVSNANQ